MNLSQIQDKAWSFIQSRGWSKFPLSLVFIHLIEECGELGRHILFEEKYKFAGLGHKPPTKSALKREFAQIFLLLLQLASKNEINLESSILSELEIMETRFDKEKWSKRMKTWSKK